MNLLSLFFAFFIVFNISFSNSFISEIELKKWGYDLIKYKELKQSQWEIESFGICKKEEIKIKSIKELSKWKNTYYRFSIIKEEYQNNILAKIRLEKLKTYPKYINTKMNPEYILRAGFYYKNFVYYISTDVLAFETKELPRLLELLEKFIKQN